MSSAGTQVNATQYTDASIPLTILSYSGSTAPVIICLLHLFLLRGTTSAGGFDRRGVEIAHHSVDLFHINK